MLKINKKSDEKRDETVTLQRSVLREVLSALTSEPEAEKSDKLEDEEEVKHGRSRYE